MRQKVNIYEFPTKALLWLEYFIFNQLTQKDLLMVQDCV